MLGWMQPGDLTEKAVCSERLESDEIGDNLHFQSNLLDENVNWASVKNWFTDCAWSKVSDAMMKLENSAKWNCYSCSSNLSLSTSVVCESCLNWYQLNCVGLTSVPKKAVWFCHLCYGSQAKMSTTNANVIIVGYVLNFVSPSRIMVIAYNAG